MAGLARITEVGGLHRGVGTHLQRWAFGELGALVLIEVWHTHAVNFRKRRAYGVLGLPWIEVKSWHVLHRYRKRPLPILDWGGAGMPEAPTQQALFDDEDVSDSTLTQPSVRSRERAPMPWSWTLLGQAASVMQGRQPPGL